MAILNKPNHIRYDQAIFLRQINILNSCATPYQTCTYFVTFGFFPLSNFRLIFSPGKCSLRHGSGCSTTHLTSGRTRQATDFPPPAPPCWLPGVWPAPRPARGDQTKQFPKFPIYRQLGGTNGAVMGGQHLAKQRRARSGVGITVISSRLQCGPLGVC